MIWTKSQTRIGLAIAFVMAAQWLLLGCSTDSQSSSDSHHPFQAAVDRSVTAAKITVHNRTNRTFVVNFSGARQTRAGHTLSPGQSWTQLLSPGNYNYSAQAANAAQTSGSVQFSGRTHYVWTLR